MVCLSASLTAQTIKSKALKIKYTLPAGWNAEEFGGKTSWEESGNTLCKCSGVSFTKQHKDGKMNVLVYPSTQSGLDSLKRNFAGPLRFENVEKFDKTRNKNFSFEKKRSNFTDKTGKKSFEVIRYFAKVDDHFYIIYTWQENMGAMSPNAEKELYEMVNAIEPN
ncbi:MAG: hypothetical protein K0S32_109 [Bacteroidetes bacterium]|jgi:hypothetical protein|nr:hypothetical protein [Bacteroidota bacterium]